MWGTDNEWMRVAIHFYLEPSKNYKEELVKHLYMTPEDREYAKRLMLENGIWEQAQQLAREMDLNIQP